VKEKERKKEREIEKERGEKSRIQFILDIDICIYIYNIYNRQREDRMLFSRKFGKNQERLFKGSLGQKDLQFLHLHFLIRVSSLISSWHALQ